MTSPYQLHLRQALSGQYRLERELGRGGMATVYLAQDLKHDRPVALKVMREEIAATLGAERFVREIRIAAQLQHPHILPLFDSGVVDGVLYYVMPYVDGETLRGRLDRERQLPVEDACTIARQVAGALAYAHSQGVVHRDIKPENILLSAGVAVVADFGIAKAISVSSDPNTTSAGFAVGTPAYMSPEQASGDQVDGRSDLYALGCLLFEMLVGQPPFFGPSPHSIIARHMADKPPPMRSVRPAIPVRLERAVMRALSKMPADRFATVWQFGEALAFSAGGAGSAVMRIADLATVPVSQGPSRPNLGPIVCKTCDRWKQVNAFDAFFRASRRSHPGRPMIVVIHGEEGEGHESLIERLLATRIAHLADQVGGSERGVVPRIRCHWPIEDSLEVRQRDLTIGLFREADPGYLGEDLSSGALATCRPLAPAPIVIVQHDIRSRQWDQGARRLLEWYVHDFWSTYTALETQPQFVVFLKIIYPASRSGPVWTAWFRRPETEKTRISRQVNEVLTRRDAMCPSLLLAELGSVTIEDVTDWFHQNHIYASEQRRRQAAEALFQSRDARRLSEVEQALEAIHREFIQEQLSEQGSLP